MMIQTFLEESHFAAWHLIFLYSQKRNQLQQPYSPASNTFIISKTGMWDAELRNNLNYSENNFFPND